jgi:translation initiation factor 4G
MVSRLFHTLNQDSIISKESFELWEKEYELKLRFNEDFERKTIFMVVFKSSVLSLSVIDSDSDETFE